jgi:Mrp family chromosome partitioning ATPase/uncharacterized protein involved in exopolysaccharide biosynthesis
MELTPVNPTPTMPTALEGLPIEQSVTDARSPGWVAVQSHRAPAIDPYLMCRQALRGRYLVFVTLVLIGAAAGAAAGWKLGKPVYKSEGLVRIAAMTPPALLGTDTNSLMLMYDAFMRSQEQVIASRRIVEMAMQDGAWRGAGRGNMSPQAIASFGSELTVQRVAGTEHIKVSFTDEEPVAAAAGVTSVINAYQAAYNANDAHFQKQRLKVLDDYEKKLGDKLDGYERKIKAVAEECGTTDVDELYEATVARVRVLDSKLIDVQLALDMPRSPEAGPGAGRQGASAPSATEPATAPLLSVEQIAAMDVRMREHVNAQSQIEAQLTDAEVRGLGDRYPEVIRLKKLLAKAEERVQRYAEEFRATQAVVTRYPDGLARNDPAALAARPVEMLRRDLEVLKRALDTAKSEMAALATKRVEVQDYKTAATKVRDDLTRAKDRRELLELEGAVSGRLEVVGTGEVPLRPSYDVRKKFAAVGAAGGGFLPAGLILLFGLLNRRYRFSDEAEEALSGNVPLLGILPTLPQKMTDVEQAASAAQCLHQIRVMLQVGVGGAQRRRGVYLVTSSTPGEGKTSLAVALGLSFAAAGSRTLLLDCDLIGQRITRGFSLDGQAGLRDALTTGKVKGYAKRTASGMWVIPVGEGDALDACAVSAGAMKRLLADARKYFDTIVIDSGPILGSVEATTVAPQTDGVIFAISRGQQPPIVEKAMRHLHSIGATVVGFVFNRAEPRDFSRSANASSLRSISADALPARSLSGDGEGSNRFGPLVQSVVSLLPSLRETVDPGAAAPAPQAPAAA